MARFILMVGGMIVCSAWAAQTPFNDAELRSALVSMTRENHCGFMQWDPMDIEQCPSYTVSISGDGTVLYEGRSGVRALGKGTHKTTVESVRALIAEFERARFFSLQDRYESMDIGDGRRQEIDHALATALVFSIGGKTKSVYDFYGTPSIVLQLEQRVDEVSDSRRYTGRPPNKPPEPTSGANGSR